MNKFIIATSFLLLVVGAWIIFAPMLGRREGENFVNKEVPKDFILKDVERRDKDAALIQDTIDKTNLLYKIQDEAIEKARKIRCYELDNRFKLKLKPYQIGNAWDKCFPKR